MSQIDKSSMDPAVATCAIPKCGQVTQIAIPAFQDDHPDWTRDKEAEKRTLDDVYPLCARHYKERLQQDRKESNLQYLTSRGVVLHAYDNGILRQLRQLRQRGEHGERGEQKDDAAP